MMKQPESIFKCSNASCPLLKENSPQTPHKPSSSLCTTSSCCYCSRFCCCCCSKCCCCCSFAAPGAATVAASLFGVSRLEWDISQFVICLICLRHLSAFPIYKYVHLYIYAYIVHVYAYVHIRPALYEFFIIYGQVCGTIYILYIFYKGCGESQQTKQCM